MQTPTREQIKMAKEYAENVVRSMNDYRPELHERKTYAKMTTEELRLQLEKAFLSGLNNTPSINGVIW